MDKLLIAHNRLDMDFINFPCIIRYWKYSERKSCLSLPYLMGFDNTSSIAPDILFIHCGGKHRIPTAIKAL